MSDPTSDLMEELDAFCPAWREVYPDVMAASLAAGVFDLYVAWVHSDAGKHYLKAFGSLPDYADRIRRLALAELGPYRSLPFSLEHLPNRYWDVKEKE